jgi:hypothetical protein
LCLNYTFIVSLSLSAISLFDMFIKTDSKTSSRDWLTPSSFFHRLRNFSLSNYLADCRPSAVTCPKRHFD